MYHDPAAIIEVFEILNASNISYLLLRNTEDELPNNLEKGKDIDILVQYHDRENLLILLKENNYRNIIHPCRSDIRLYGVHNFEMFASTSQVLLDVNYEIVVRSLDKGQWIPLDAALHSSAWRSAQIVDLGGVCVPMLGNEDLLVYTLARCVFDKKKFSPWYCKMLSRLLPLVDHSSLEEKLKLVFFKYTGRLLALVKSGNYEIIYQDYMAFKDY